MMSKKKIDFARKKIDQIDNNIFNLIKKRTSVVRHMLKLKKLKKQIVDQKRNKEILKSISYDIMYLEIGLTKIGPKKYVI